MLFSMGRLAAGFAAAVLSAHMANAAEIKVFSTIGVQAGESADLMVLTKQSFDALTKDGKAGAGAVFASSGMGLVVKQGTPKPDISTPEAKAVFKARGLKPA